MLTSNKKPIPKYLLKKEKYFGGRKKKWREKTDWVKDNNEIAGAHKWIKISDPYEKEINYRVRTNKNVIKSLQAFLR